MTFLKISPYLYYEDAGAALDWLARVLGFGATRRMVVDGKVEEAEIEVGPATVHLTGRAPGPDDGPGALLIVGVDDVDKQYERVRSAGVEADPPKDEAYGPRTFHVTDPWGYKWYFWQGEAIYPE
ncbi:MAG TPA: VOC family protein [Pseudonocardiaceae bacterium]|nr:VOC family protein [Pseudonocardiaceae bacterium]